MVTGSYGLARLLRTANGKRSREMWQPNLKWLTSLEGFMEYFRVDHPQHRLILCNRSNCEAIADYLEVNEQGHENFACAAHTSSGRHASVLPRGAPKPQGEAIRCD